MPAPSTEPRPMSAAAWFDCIVHGAYCQPTSELCRRFVAQTSWYSLVEAIIRSSSPTRRSAWSPGWCPASERSPAFWTCSTREERVPGCTSKGPIKSRQASTMAAGANRPPSIEARRSIRRPYPWPAYVRQLSAGEVDPLHEGAAVDPLRSLVPALHRRWIQERLAHRRHVCNVGEYLVAGLGRATAQPQYAHEQLGRTLDTCVARLLEDV